MNIIDLLIKTEALLEGHFLLSSGLHSNRYVQTAKVLKFPEYAQRLREELGNTRLSNEHN